MRVVLDEDSVLLREGIARILDEAGIEYVDLGASFARRAEDLHWAQLEQAEPQFVERIRPLLTSAD